MIDTIFIKKNIIETKTVVLSLKFQELITRYEET